MLGVIVVVVVSRESMDNTKERHKAHHCCLCCPDNNKQIGLCTARVPLASHCVVNLRTINYGMFGPIMGVAVLVPWVCLFLYGTFGSLNTLEKCTRIYFS